MCYKLNIGVHKDLNLTLNDQVYNRNYNAYIEKTRFWCDWRRLTTDNGGQCLRSKFLE